MSTFEFLWRIRTSNFVQKPKKRYLRIKSKWLKNKTIQFSNGTWVKWAEECECYCCQVKNVFLVPLKNKRVWVCVRYLKTNLT